MLFLFLILSFLYSGIDSVKKYGVNAVLVGESLVVSDDPGKKLRELL